MPLTRSTQIPTHARGKVRALVKAHKHWPVFLAENNLTSASVKNAELIDYALRYSTLRIQIETILLAAEIEALLREAGKRAADEYKARRQAARDEAALDNFNYVGSRHHY